MRIAIMGSGGIGGYVGGRLAAAGEDVSFIARGAHLEAMKSDGLRIESPLGDLHLPRVAATSDPAEIGPVDLVLFSVKLWDTESAAQSLAPLMTPSNSSADPAERDRQHRSHREISAEGTDRRRSRYLSAVIRAPGVIATPGGSHRIIMDGMGGDPVIAAFRDACARAVAIDAEATEAIDLAIWQKFIVSRPFPVRPR